VGEGRCEHLCTPEGESDCGSCDEMPVSKEDYDLAVGVGRVQSLCAPPNLGQFTTQFQLESDECLFKCCG
jgi:hypothetical protein